MLTDAWIVVIGGGVAGLHTAYLLTDAGFAPPLLEREEHVGGLCSDHDRKMYHNEKYDHLIFLSDDDVIWRDLTKDEFATPQLVVGYRGMMPTNPTEVGGLFLTGGFQGYPFSRNLNTIIEVKSQAVEELTGYIQTLGGQAVHARVA
ncbi:MAG: NAD(P)-binding protein [Candidatus Undinarchaeales archaeon]|jgi:cation diffusion facilitator CzcD-associated flavoprotein CzcO|nr:NAD(P)-binding protein [Candidatus Undinarchaeales archaeon]MDP7494689.1 NAD(P)-binding protein [Candidatus Undinarchaeales archaeon]